MKDDDRNTCADFIWIDDGDRWRPGSSVCYVSCRKSAGIVTGDHFDGRRAFTSYHYWNCSRSDQLYYTGKTKWEKSEDRDCVRSNRGSYPVTVCSNFSAFVGCKKWWIK